jgi:hypothetical protein
VGRIVPETKEKAMAVGTLWSVTLDCAEPAPLAEFWAAMLGGEVAHSSDNFVGVETPSGLWIGAYRVDDYVPPRWPAGDPSSKQFHLDVTVEDLDAGERGAMELGATKADEQPQPDRWRVLFDPAGHPFCVTAG